MVGSLYRHTGRKAIHIVLIPITMLQDIIVYIIIGAVTLILLRNAAKLFKAPKENDKCPGCNACDIGKKSHKGKEIDKKAE